MSLSLQQTQLEPLIEMQNENIQNVTDKSIRIIGLFGTGRCGSTWLGAMFNSHPELIYRFEPFLRSKGSSQIRKIRSIIESNKVLNVTIKDVYNELVPANPKVDRPPFFPKCHGHQFCKKWFWLLSRKLPMFHRLFECYYTPRITSNAVPILVFKEVGLELMMTKIIEREMFPIVYLVRHPCGVVSSMLQGQARQKMPTGRLGVLPSLLEKHDSKLASLYAGRVHELNDCQKNALLWRIDVEKGIRAARGNRNVFIVVYEDLCRNPLMRAKEIFGRHKISMHENTKNFITRSVSNDQRFRRSSGEGLINDYFSVYRNPLDSIELWKEKLSSDQKKQVMKIVEDSDAFQCCWALGHWDPV